MGYAYDMVFSFLTSLVTMIFKNNLRYKLFAGYKGINNHLVKIYFCYFFFFFDFITVKKIPNVNIR